MKGNNNDKNDILFHSLSYRVIENIQFNDFKLSTINICYTWKQRISFYGYWESVSSSLKTE